MNDLEDIFDEIMGHTIKGAIEVIVCVLLLGCIFGWVLL